MSSTPTLVAVHLPVLAADPGNASDGDAYVNSVSNRVRVRLLGVWYTQAIVTFDVPMFASAYKLQVGD